jgi:hypothetical protein
MLITPYRRHHCPLEQNLNHSAVKRISLSKVWPSLPMKNKPRLPTARSCLAPKFAGNQRDPWLPADWVPSMSGPWEVGACS